MTFIRCARSLVAVAACTSAVFAAARPMRSAQTTRSHVYVTIVDEKGQPVTGLGVADFAVQMNGARQEILDVRPAATPLSIVMLTDQLGLHSNYTPVESRQSMAAFVKTIRDGNDGAKFALTTIDGPVRPLTSFDTAPALLDRAISRLVGVGTDSAYLDAVVHASRAMLSAPTDRRVIFSLFGAYRPDQSSERSDATGEYLGRAQASLWAVEVIGDLLQGGNYASMPREVMLANGTRVSGGARMPITSRQTLVPAVTRMASLILAQYDISFGPGVRSDGSTITVGVARQNVQVLGPKWDR